MAALGTLTIDGGRGPSTGEAWFDHQWGDFITIGGGGWDWFASTSRTARTSRSSLVRDADGSYPLVYGTLVGGRRLDPHLPRDAFRWT
jgi:predicted secreted hydrolase